MPRSRLLLEITETALFTDLERATAVLERLSSAGIAISLDDFGQGQTSLGFLSRLPLAELKIDRAFVTDMLGDPAHAAIVRSVVELGHNLSLRVVGEGVETQQQLAVLLQLQCQFLQGYLFSKARPGSDVAEIVEAPALELKPAHDAAI